MRVIEDQGRRETAGDLGALGRYQLLEPIASGGMGAVYLARLVGAGGFEKFVALKVLLPEISGNARFIAMFLDEARIAARLSHPNLCEVYELGEADGRHFIAMQYLRGVPLTEVMRRAPVDREAHIRVVATLIAQACEGLHHAHQLTDQAGAPLSIVHRDVSPPNLFVTTEGVVKVLDFGIAKARDVESKTRRSEVKGKQAYMSPEQLVGKELDARSDLFALGIVFYEAITGTRLFSRDTDYLTAKAILEDEIEHPTSRRPEVPPALAEVAMRTLARRPGDRYQNAREFGRAIAEALAPSGLVNSTDIAEYLAAHFGARISAEEARFERATKAAKRMADTSLPTSRRISRPRKRRPLWVALVVLAALASAVAIALVIMAREPTSATATLDAGVAIDGGNAQAAIVTALPADAAPKRADAAVADAAESDRRRGRISIDSTPYATIYVDGRKVGVTPLIDFAVKPGKRRIKAVLASGETKRFSIRVKPGKRAPAKRLTW